MATSPGAVDDASASFRLLLALSRLSPSIPCHFSSIIFSRTLLFILSAPASLTLALNIISANLSLPLPLVCSSVSMFVTAVVAAEEVLKSKALIPAPERILSFQTFPILDSLHLLLKDPPCSPLISPSLFISSLSRALSNQGHFLSLRCTSLIAESMAFALKSGNLQRVARVAGGTCNHMQSQCRDVYEWALVMRNIARELLSFSRLPRTSCSSPSSLVQLVIRLHLVFDMREEGCRCIATRQLVDAAVTTTTGSVTGFSDANISDTSTSTSSAVQSPPCVAAFVNVCSHALTLLSNSYSNTDILTPQSGYSFFDVRMRRVTVLSAVSRQFGTSTRLPQTVVLEMLIAGLKPSSLLFLHLESPHGLPLKSRINWSYVEDPVRECSAASLSEDPAAILNQRISGTSEFSSTHKHQRNDRLPWKTVRAVGFACVPSVPTPGAVESIAHVVLMDDPSIPFHPHSAPLVTPISHSFNISFELV